MADSIDDRIAALESRIAQLEGQQPVAPAVSRPAAGDGRAAALEAKLGTYWLSRIGVVSLISGAALAILTYFTQLDPVVRVALGYATAGAVAWLGLGLARAHPTFGRIVFGGGLAVAYFVTYALHFVPALRIIDSEPLGILLVAAAIAGIVAIAHRMQSETVAGIALFLALHTGLLSEVTSLSLIAATLLAAGAGFFLAANRWVIVPLSAVVAVYSTHATLAFGDAPVEPALRVAFVAIDFALFAAALVIRPDVAARPRGLLAALNWLGAIVLGTHAALAISRDAAFLGLCGFAGVQLAIAAGARARRASHGVVALELGFSLVTVALALPVRLHGAALLAGWLVLALVTAVLARAGEPRFTALGLSLVLAGYVEVEIYHLGGIAQLVAVVAMVVVERGAARASALRSVAISGVALGLVALALRAAPPGLHTLACVGAASALFAAGFALRAAAYRWNGFAVLGLAALRLVAVELRGFTPGQRILTFVLVGVALLVVSFGYTRRERRR